MKRLWLWFTIVIAIAVAACSGQSASPVVPGASGPNAMHPSRLSANGRGNVSFSIRIPVKKSSHGRFVPKYVSYNTKSVAIAVDGGKPKIVNLDFFDGCTFANYYWQCYLTFQVTAGQHTFSVVTYDKANAKGNVLSANTKTPFNVVSGSNTPLFITLGGIAHAIWGGGNPPNVPGNMPGQYYGTAFNVYGHQSFGFSFQPIDADNNAIYGSGVPSVKITIPKGAPVQIVLTPKPGFQNIWVFQPTYHANSPIAGKSIAIQAVATPVPNSGGVKVTSTISWTFYEPWVYVVNFNAWSVKTFDENGNAKPVTAPSPFSHVPNPTGFAYNPNNKWPYIPDLYDNLICVYTLQGGFISSSGFPNLQEPTDIAYVNVNGADRFYVVNSGFDGAPPRPGRHVARPGRRRPHTVTGGITVYDADGNQITTSGLFPGITSPQGITYDSHNGMLYVTDNSQNTVFEYDLQGNLMQSFGNTLPDTGYAGIAFDQLPHYTQDGTSYWLYAIDNSNTKIVVFDENGVVQTPSGSFPSMNNPYGITYDQYSGYFYVTSNGSSTIGQYSDQGVLINSWTEPGASPGPWGIGVVSVPAPVPTATST